MKKWKFTSTAGRYHIISTYDGRWGILKNGNSRCSSIVKTPSEGVKKVKKAKDARMIVVHDKNGCIKKIIDMKDNTVKIFL